MAHVDERPDLRVFRPLGTFHAVAQRDAASSDRHGATFYAANELSGSVLTWEIIFGDGVWLLASSQDLVWPD